MLYKNNKLISSLTINGGTITAIYKGDKLLFGTPSDSIKDPSISDELKTIIVRPSEAEVCDVAYANKNTNRVIVVKKDKWNTDILPKDTWEPIGIVVIPGTHGVIKDGSGLHNQCGIISIQAMNGNTPGIGSDTPYNIAFGSYGSIIGKPDNLGRYDSYNEDGLTTYHRIAVSQTNDNVPKKLSSLAAADMPTQDGVGQEASYGFRITDYAPSPYIDNTLNSGLYNTLYGTTEFDSDYHNAFADFRGIVNTKIITDAVESMGIDWRTEDVLDASITNNKKYPATTCCARYKTVGTKSFAECSIEELYKGEKFWYLPSLGELGYIPPRISDIDNTIELIKESYNIGVKLNHGMSSLRAYYYWASTIWGTDYAWYIHVTSGSINTNMTGYEYPAYVRAFCRLGDND